MTQKERGKQGIVVMADLRCPSDAVLVALRLRVLGTGLVPVCVKGKKMLLIRRLMLAFLIGRRRRCRGEEDLESKSDVLILHVFHRVAGHVGIDADERL